MDECEARSRPSIFQSPTKGCARFSTDRYGFSSRVPGRMDIEFMGMDRCGGTPRLEFQIVEDVCFQNPPERRQVLLYTKKVV